MLDLQRLQLDWLQEDFRQGNLFGVAFNVTRHPGIAEEAVQNALVSIIDQIHRNVCPASCREQFFGWVNEIVRTQAKRAIGGGRSGIKRFMRDVLIDRAAERRKQLIEK